MFRLVYFDPLAGYGSYDAHKYSQIIDTDRDLKAEGKDVVCIVDYDEQAIIHKSHNYTNHRDKVDDFIFDYEFLNS